MREVRKPPEGEMAAFSSGAADRSEIAKASIERKNERMSDKRILYIQVEELFLFRLYIIIW